MGIVLAMRNWAVSLKLVFVILLVEGAFRKWIVPGASDFVYFIKDAVLIGVYLGFWVKGFQRPRKMDLSAFPMAGLRLSLLPVILLSFNPNVGSLSAALLGARGYLFYLPIVFIVPYIFKDRETMIRQVTMYTLLAIPVCLLGVLQFRSDSFSVINTYASGTSQWGASMIGSSGKVRVTGTFSYLSGHVVFVSVFSALAIALISMRGAPYKKTLTYVALPLLVGNVFMSGSRAAFLVFAVIAVGFAINKMGALSPAGRRHAARTVAAIAFAAIVLGGVLFYDAVDALYTRSKNASDSIKVRLVDQTVDSLSQAWEKGGLLGCGVGTTSPAVRALRRRLRLPMPKHRPGFYDHEMGQVFAEIGFAGLIAWYSFRALVVVSTWRAYKMCRDEQLRTLILAAFLVSGPYLIMSLVLNHVACVLIWGMAGLSLAALRFSKPDSVTVGQA